MTTEERFEETFVVSEVRQLEVSNVRGSITVQSDDRDDIRVFAVKCIGSGNSQRTNVEIYQEDNRIIARTRYHGNGGRLRCMQNDRVCSVDYEVSVPSMCDVTVKQINGEIYIRDVNGHVSANLVNGAAKLHRVDGHAQVKGVSATIQGDSWTGRAQVDTVSGKVQISNSRLSRIRANTVSGSLAVETTVDADGRYDFHSISGDVALYLPSDVGLQSRGTTISGRLVCDLQHVFTRQSRGGWKATINGGGPPVRFKSVSGDLQVLSG